MLDILKKRAGLAVGQSFLLDTSFLENYLNFNYPFEICVSHVT